MTRIYPDHLPVVSDEPCWEDFCVLDVDAHRGQGVLVLRDFPKDSILFRMNGNLSTEMTLHSLQLGPNLHLDDPYCAGKVLHSCQPNSWLDTDTRLFHATRMIRRGELLTMDYDQTEDILYRAFFCCCGSPNCRGFIGGRLATKPRRKPRRLRQPIVLESGDLPARLYESVMQERSQLGIADMAATTAN